MPAFPRIGILLFAQCPPPCLSAPSGPDGIFQGTSGAVGQVLGGGEVRKGHGWDCGWGWFPPRWMGWLMITLPSLPSPPNPMGAGVWVVPPPSPACNAIAPLTDQQKGFWRGPQPEARAGTCGPGDRCVRLQRLVVEGPTRCARRRARSTPHFRQKPVYDCV